MFSFLLYSLVLVVLVLWVDSEVLSFNNPLNLKRSAGDQLEEWLKKFNWHKRHEIPEKGLLPQYKFYSQVVETLLSLARRMGGNYQDALLFLREGLQSDRQFEKKLKEAVLGTWLQMLFTMLLTWTFILGATHLVELKISFFKLLLVAGWQTSGLWTLPFLLRYYRHKFFSDIGTLWKMLYILQSLARVPLSRSEIFQVAGVQELKTITQKNLLPLVEKIQDTCQKALRQGGSYEEEVKYLMEELRFQEKWYFELFEKDSQ